jgi:hypothetical protein
LIGYPLGSLLLDYSGLIYLLITSALFLVLLNGYLKQSPGDGHA